MSYETCVLAKSHRATYSPSFSNKSVIPFELIHSDVWGPSRELTTLGMRYFVLFIDDCTRLTWATLLKTNDEVFPAFQAFHTLIQTQYNSTIKVLRSDNGGEYVNHAFQEFFKIMALSTKPRVHKHQNKMECLKEKTVIYLIWLVPFSLVLICLSIFGAMLYKPFPISSIVSHLVSFREKIPFKVLASHGSVLSFHNLPTCVFGCVAFVHILKNQKSKLNARALKCVFVGYGGYQKGYKCYHPPT